MKTGVAQIIKEGQLIYIHKHTMCTQYMYTCICTRIYLRYVLWLSGELVRKDRRDLIMDKLRLIFPEDMQISKI